MIDISNVFRIGKIEKVHGLNGELSFSFTTDVFDTAEATYFIVETDGILVPFYIESYRLKSDNAGLIKFEGVDNEEKAREFTGLEIFLPKSFLNEMEEAEIGLEYFVGFTVIENENTIGIIQEIDDTTENTLFIIERNGDDLLIPVVDEYIVEIDHEEKILKMDLPEGLLEL